MKLEGAWSKAEGEFHPLVFEIEWSVQNNKLAVITGRGRDKEGSFDLKGTIDKGHMILKINFFPTIVFDGWLKKDLQLFYGVWSISEDPHRMGSFWIASPAWKCDGCHQDLAFMKLVACTSCTKDDGQVYRLCSICVTTHNQKHQGLLPSSQVFSSQKTKVMILQN
jgi:hypothetical protein